MHKTFKILKLSFLFGLMLNANSGIGQSLKDYNYFLKGTMQYGYVFQTNKFIRGLNPEKESINSVRTAALRLGVQTKGEKYWENEFNKPQYGLQLQVVDFGEPDFVGTPIVVSWFFTAPFVKKNKVLFGYDVGLGAAFNWKPFNPITNNTNISIGARESFYFDLGLFYNYQISKKLGIETGLNLSHYSSGALKMPNLGFNTVAPKLGVNYKLYNTEPEFFKYEKKPFRGVEMEASVFGGAKNVIFDSINIDLIQKYEGVNFPVFGISTSINKRLNYKSKIGLGATLDYNGAIDAQIAVSNNEVDIVPTSFTDKLQLSIYPSYALTAGSFTAIIQPSFYIARKPIKNQTAFFYQRLGIRYNFKNNIFLGFNLRAYDYHVSDFIEWNIGYNLIK
jgi:hypothetical protein